MQSLNILFLVKMFQKKQIYGKLLHISVTMISQIINPIVINLFETVDNELIQWSIKFYTIFLD